MTTTDTDALTERIGRILNDEGWTFEGVHEPGEYDECEECRLAVDPIAARVAREVAEEVRKAKAEAWDEGHNTRRTVERGGWYLNPYRETGDPVTYPSMEDLRRASTEAHLRPIRRDIDAAVAALPWHGRLIYRAVLPIARIIYRVRRTP